MKVSSTIKLMPSVPPLASTSSGSLVIGISVGLAMVGLLALTTTITLCLQRRKRRKASNQTSALTSGASAEITDETYEYVPQSIEYYSYPMLEGSNKAYGAVLQELVLTQNAASDVGQEEVNLSMNVAYIAAALRGDGDMDDYPVLPTDNIPVSLNPAYIALHIQEDLS